MNDGITISGVNHRNKRTVVDGCLNVFGMAVDLLEAPFAGGGLDPWKAAFAFCWTFRPKTVMLFSVLSSAAEHCVASGRALAGAGPRGKQVALGQKTASGAYEGCTTRGGPAASGFAGSLAVHVAGARRGDPAPGRSCRKRCKTR